MKPRSGESNRPCKHHVEFQAVCGYCVSYKKYYDRMNAEDAADRERERERAEAQREAEAEFDERVLESLQRWLTLGVREEYGKLYVTLRYKGHDVTEDYTYLPTGRTGSGEL